MRLGIAIPNRNHGSVIGRLLDAVVPQHPDEIVVMDDASDDDSREVVARYPSVRLVCHAEKTADHNVAISDVVSRMNVDYVTMAGADDRIYDGFVDSVRNDHGGGVVFCDYDVLDEGGGVLARRRSGFGSVVALTPEEARARLVRADVGHFECGVGSAVGMEAHRWLVDRGGYAMGPWIDSIGNSILACIFGAVYIPRPLAGFTVSQTGSNWHVRVLSDPVESRKYRDGIMQFFMHPDVYALGSELLSAIAMRWGA